LNEGNDVIKRAWISLAIESALIEISNIALEKVTRNLPEKYDCYIPDCYDHPQYLK